MRLLKLLQSAILGAAVWTAIVAAGGAAETPTAAKQHVLCWIFVGNT